MRYYKISKNGYIIGIGTGASSTAISKTEYNQILDVIRTSPKAPNGYQYLLKENLEWELVALPPIEPEPLTDEEAITRYANSLTGQNDPDLLAVAETLITDRIKED